MNKSEIGKAEKGLGKVLLLFAGDFPKFHVVSPWKLRILKVGPDEVHF